MKMFRRQAYFYASVAFLVVWIVYTVAVFYQPYVGLELENVNDQWIVTYSDPQGEGYKSGVRVGDWVIKLNNDDPAKYRLVRIWSEAEGASTLEVGRFDQSNVQVINIPELPFLQGILSEITFAIMGAIFWLLGFMTWFRRPFLAQARSLFWLNWSTGLAIVLAPASSRDLLLARELEYIIFATVPIFLINFFSVFPKENKNQVNQLGRQILIILSVIILIMTVLQSIGIVHFFSILRKLVLVTVSIGVLLTLWNLIALLKLPKDKPEKNLSNILLMGMAIGFLPFILLTAIPEILGFQPIMNARVSSLFVSVIPVTWYYAIVNKYLPDSRRLLGTIISYFVAGMCISFIVSYLYFSLKLSSAFNLALYLMMLALSIAFILAFSLIRVLISKLFDKYLFLEGKQAFKKQILKLNESISKITEEDLMLEEVVKSLAIEGALIIVEDDKGGYLKKAAGIFLDKPSKQVKVEEFFQYSQRINLETKILPDDLQAEIYIPFVFNEFRCGIFLGHRFSHIKFAQDELPLITLISSQLAQRLIMTFSIKELSTEIKDLAQRSLDSQRRSQGLHGITNSLFRNIEQERKLIAREIHDGPLQLGLDLNRWLKHLTEEYLTEAEKEKTFFHLRELVENPNYELRLICNGLRPPTLSDLGLLPAIELMCEESMQKELLLISLETIGMSRNERFSEDTELAAFRFVQEGIMNAVKHSGSSKLKIRVERNEYGIELTVSDSGKGFDPSKIRDWLLTGAHYGIIGMNERIENLGGNLQINSANYQGTTLKAAIPVKQVNS